MASPFQRYSRATVVAGAAAAGLLVIGAPVTAFALTGTFSSSLTSAPAHAGASGNSEGGPHWTVGAKSAVVKAAAVKAGTSAAGLPVYGYVAAAGGDEVIKVDVATDSIVGEYGADTGEGIAVTPSGSTLYIAQTGQYSVIATNLTTGAQAEIEVGAYPQAGLRDRDRRRHRPGRIGPGRGHRHRDQHGDELHHGRQRAAPGGL